jgi:3',5'-cyclic AMP phosphodiesterase CpdA
MLDGAPRRAEGGYGLAVMRVVQLSDLHLGPEDHAVQSRREANRVAWDNARSVAAALREWPDADALVIVITGDLTDDGHTFPAELDAAAAWVATLPGTVLVLPGNHDVGNFPASGAQPPIQAAAVEAWKERFGADRIALARDGHRLVGLNSMLWGSGRPPEADQDQWLVGELDAAEAAGEGVWVFQHAPLFLRSPDEVRSERELYWCPPPAARDRVLKRLDRPCVRGISHGHIHRRFELTLDGRLYRACPALSGTHTDADYFLRDDAVGRHELSCYELAPKRAEALWLPTGIGTKVRYAG